MVIRSLILFCRTQIQVAQGSGAGGGYGAILQAALAQRGVRSLYQGFPAALANYGASGALGFATYEVGLCAWLACIVGGPALPTQAPALCSVHTSAFTLLCHPGVVGRCALRGARLVSQATGINPCSPRPQVLLSNYTRRVTHGDPPSATARGALGGVAAFVTMLFTLPLENVRPGAVAGCVSE